MDKSYFDKEDMKRGVKIVFPEDGKEGFLEVGHRTVRPANSGYVRIASRRIRKELIRYIVDSRKYQSAKPEVTSQLRDAFGVVMQRMVDGSGKSSVGLAEDLDISARYIRSLSNGKRWPKLEVIKSILSLWSIDIWKFWGKVSEVYDEKYNSD